MLAHHKAIFAALVWRFLRCHVIVGPFLYAHCEFDIKYYCCFAVTIADGALSYSSVVPTSMASGLLNRLRVKDDGWNVECKTMTIPELNPTFTLSHVHCFGYGSRDLDSATTPTVRVQSRLQSTEAIRPIRRAPYRYCTVLTGPVRSILQRYQ